MNFPPFTFRKLCVSSHSEYLRVKEIKSFGEIKKLIGFPEYFRFLNSLYPPETPSPFTQTFPALSSTDTLLFSTFSSENTSALSVASDRPLGKVALEPLSVRRKGLRSL